MSRTAQFGYLHLLVGRPCGGHSPSSWPRSHGIVRCLPLRLAAGLETTLLRRSPANGLPLLLLKPLHSGAGEIIRYGLPWRPECVFRLIYRYLSYVLSVPSLTPRLTIPAPVLNLIGVVIMLRRYQQARTGETDSRKVLGRRRGRAGAICKTGTCEFAHRKPVYGYARYHAIAHALLVQQARARVCGEIFQGCGLRAHRCPQSSAGRSRRPPMPWFQHSRRTAISGIWQ